MQSSRYFIIFKDNSGGWSLFANITLESCLYDDIYLMKSMQTKTYSRGMFIIITFINFFLFLYGF